MHSVGTLQDIPGHRTQRASPAANSPPLGVFALPAPGTASGPRLPCSSPCAWTEISRCTWLRPQFLSAGSKETIQRPVCRACWFWSTVVVTACRKFMHKLLMRCRRMGSSERLSNTSLSSLPNFHTGSITSVARTSITEAHPSTEGKIAHGTRANVPVPEVPAAATVAREQRPDSLARSKS